VSGPDPNPDRPEPTASTSREDVQAGAHAAVSGEFPDRDRLPDAENQRLFDELIVLAEFAGVEPVDDPRAIFTGGQAGSGKSHAKSLLGATFGAAGYVDIGTDALRVYHPRWLELLEKDPATATLYTQADAQAWVARSVAYAAERGMNVIMDSTLSREGEVGAFLAQFRAHGYRTEIAFVAAPLAQSWLGNLARYQGMLEAQGQGRISLREPYERGAAQILTVLAHLEHQAPIDQLSVYRRGGTLLYRNTRRPDGQWSAPPAAAQVIEQERRRQWSTQETDAFLQELGELAERMAPQHRPDLAYAVELALPVVPTAAHRAELARLQARFGPSGVTPATPADAAAARRAATALQPPPRGTKPRPAAGPGTATGPPAGPGPGRDDPDPGRRPRR
jgi:predicted kinase